MSSEKVIPILEKSNSNEGTKEKISSKTLLSWLLAVILLVVLILLTVEFIYPIISYERISIIERPVESPLNKSKSSKKSGAWDGKFLMNPSLLCDTRQMPGSLEYEEEPEIKLLIVVTSAVGNEEKRNAIRNTWGSVATSSNGPIRLAFMVGTSTNLSDQESLLLESNLHHDIIQADFADTYRNLTRKSVAMLRWVSEFCPHTLYFLKADDDTFVNVAVVSVLLEEEPYASQPKFIGGYVHQQAKPVKDKIEKYYDSLFEDEEYPAYASGSAYVTRGHTAAELFDAAQELESLLPMEDVFVTGLCGKNIGANLIHDPRFHFDSPAPDYTLVATAHGLGAWDMMDVWDQLTDQVLNYLEELERDLNKTKAKL